MKLAARVGRITPSPTLAMAATAKAMAAHGIDVVDFSSGEPDFDTPEPVKAAAEAAIRAGFTKYTPSSGIDELRQAIADKLQAEQGIRYEKSQVLVSCGAKHSLYNLAEALLEAGDESHHSRRPIGSPTPIRRCLTMRPRCFLPTREEDGYAINSDELERLLRRAPKPLSSIAPAIRPEPPTIGRHLERLADLALRRDLLVISDEIYEKVLYDGVVHIEYRLIGAGDCSPDRRHQWCLQSLCDDRVADRLCGRSERSPDRHGKYSESKHLQPLLHFTESCCRRLA